MKKFLLVCIVLLFWVNLSQAACVADGDNWASTPDYSSLNTCVGNADSGDTITVSAGDGTETWASQLSITKGLTIIGPGESSLTVTSTYSSSATTSSGYLVLYEPSDNTERAAGFRITGFTFDLDGNCQGIGLYNNSTTPSENVIVDECTFDNARQIALMVDGLVYGVTYNSNYTANGTSGDCMNFSGLGSTSWSSTTASYGSGNNFYVEDCTINNYTGDTFDADTGGRYVARFNTLNNLSGASQGLKPAFNFHGNNATSSHGSMLAEIYHNIMNELEGESGYFFTQRGGKVISFDNNFVGNMSFGVRVYDYGSGPTDGCDNELSPEKNLVDSTPVYPSDSYHWNSKDDGTKQYGWGYNSSDHFQIPQWTGYSSGCITSGNYPIVCCDAMNPPDTDDIPSHDREVWFHIESFDGASGVGVGTLALMPATCTTGVAYWATDQGNWNANGDDGVLYKCTSTDTWEVYYTPYTYPHPLRDETATPSASGITFSGVTIGQ
jgi:hypothetical protein